MATARNRRAARRSTAWESTNVTGASSSLQYRDIGDGALGQRARPFRKRESIRWTARGAVDDLLQREAKAEELGQCRDEIEDGTAVIVGVEVTRDYVRRYPLRQRPLRGGNPNPFAPCPTSRRIPRAIASRTSGAQPHGRLDPPSPARNACVTTSPASSFDKSPSARNANRDVCHDGDSCLPAAAQARASTSRSWSPAMFRVSLTFTPRMRSRCFAIVPAATVGLTRFRSSSSPCGFSEEKVDCPATEMFSNA